MWIPNPAKAAGAALWVIPQSDTTHPWSSVRKGKEVGRRGREGWGREKGEERGVPWSPSYSRHRPELDGFRRHRHHWLWCMSTWPPPCLLQLWQWTEDLQIYILLLLNDKMKEKLKKKGKVRWAYGKSLIGCARWPGCWCNLFDTYTFLLDSRII